MLEAPTTSWGRGPQEARPYPQVGGASRAQQKLRGLREGLRAGSRKKSVPRLGYRNGRKGPTFSPTAHQTLGSKSVVGVPRAAHPDPGERHRDSKHHPTSLKGTGDLGMWPKVLSSLQFPWMGLRNPVRDVWGSLAEGHPLLRPLPSVTSGPFKSWRLQ